MLEFIEDFKPEAFWTHLNYPDMTHWFHFWELNKLSSPLSVTNRTQVESVTEVCAEIENQSKQNVLAGYQTEI